MLMINRSLEWQEFAFAPKLPPPLCFTVPNGNPMGNNGQFEVGRKTLVVTLRDPKLMMEPDNPATWQRTYRFT